MSAWTPSVVIVAILAELLKVTPSEHFVLFLVASVLLLADFELFLWFFICVILSKLPRVCLYQLAACWKLRLVSDFYLSRCDAPRD